ncbi:hypothetical protein [Allgaiera indica]|uniref:hypothetical protein n=1 Tax=Allgaiera indica TaxID=765699 RepID=UPI00136322CA|nr:hypothetical protein [Allgaiera indica]
MPPRSASQSQAAVLIRQRRKVRGLPARRHVLHSGLQKNRHLLGGELEALPIGHPLRGDGILWPPWVYAGDPESFATGAELPSKITGRKAEGFGERLKPKLLRVQRASIRKWDGNSEGNFEAPAEVDIAQAFVVDGQSIPFRDLAASLEHFALEALTKSGRQISGGLFFDTL